MELSTKEVKYPIVALKSYDDWNDFYENLEKLCRSMKLRVVQDRKPDIVLDSWIVHHDYIQFFQSTRYVRY
ncbi:hypothetical protein E4U47_007891 [Claviceps purpurea]|nr:hypothetical protein E4U47_007891 [Claviceps purpurea]